MTQTKAQLLDGKSATIQFTGGSASAPAISFTGDTNTGIYSPGADQVAISTNGTGRLFVDASGNVVVSGGGQITSRNVGASPGLGRIQIGDSGAWTVEGLDTGYGGSGAYLKISSGASERMRLDSSGRLGLGTSSPNANSQLHIVGSSYQPLYCNTTGVGGGGAAFSYSGTQALYVGTGGSSWLTGSSTADGLIRAEANLVFATNGNTRAVTIDSSQRVGVGTASPGALLDLRSASPSLHISDASGTPDYRGYSLDLSRSQQTGGINFSIASPSAFLDLYSGGSASNLGGWDGQIRFFTGGSNSYGTERARIDSSGRLLVGTSSSASAGLGQYAFAQVQGNSTNSSGQAIFSLRRGSVPGSGSALGEIVFSDNTGNEYALISAVGDGVSGSGDYPGRLVFSTTADGSSSPTERMRITSTGQVRLAGAGITFNGDTATANELDDYEEGTWTPALSGPASQTYSAQTGYYVKIGSTVYLSGRISWSVAPTGGSNYKIVLPFGSATNRPESMNAMPIHKNTNNANIVYLSTFANTADAFFYTRSGTAANFAGQISTGELTFAGVYAVN